jgi:hypothetical protein
VSKSRTYIDARRWLALLLAGLMFGTALAGAAHAVNLDGHAVNEVCEICATIGTDSGALPVTADHPVTDLKYCPAAGVVECERISSVASNACPRAPPA